MPKYIKEIPEYIPGIQPWRPNLQLYQNVLTRRQQQFNAGQEKVDSLYNSIFNADLTRPDDIKKRDEFLKLADNEIKRLSTVDLSNPANKKAAYSIFKPFYEDDNIMHDIGYTKQVKKAYQEAEDSRKCIGDDCPEFWNGSLRYIDYKKQEYANSTDEEALSMGAPRFIPAQNISKDGVDLIKDAGLEIKYSQMSEDGRWIYNVKNGEQFIPSVNSFLQSTLGSDPKYLDYYNAQAYLDKKDWMSQNSMKYQSEELAEERYAKEALDNSWDVYSDEQMKNNITLSVIDHKQSAMEEWLAQGNIPLPSDIKDMESTDSQKQIVNAEKQRLERIKQLHDAYGVNVNDPSTYVSIIEQITANNLLGSDILNVAESYSMATKEITGFKANPYEVARIKHNYKMEEIQTNAGLKGINDWIKQQKKIKKANEDLKEQEDKGGADNKLDVEKPNEKITKKEAKKAIEETDQENSQKIQKQEKEDIEDIDNKIEEISNNVLPEVLQLLGNDKKNAPYYGIAILDNYIEDLFGNLSLGTIYGNQGEYNKRQEWNEIDTPNHMLYYHYPLGNSVEAGYWDNTPYKLDEIKSFLQRADADGMKWATNEDGELLINNVDVANAAISMYGLVKDPITYKTNIKRDSQGNANFTLPKINDDTWRWNLADYYVTVDNENKQNQELIKPLNKLLQFIGSELINLKRTKIDNTISCDGDECVDPNNLWVGDIEGTEFGLKGRNFDDFYNFNESAGTIDYLPNYSNITGYNEGWVKLSDRPITISLNAYEIEMYKNTFEKVRNIPEYRTGKPTPGDLLDKKLEIQNWLISPDRSHTEIKQFMLNFSNYTKDDKIHNTNTFKGIDINKAGKIFQNIPYIDRDINILEEENSSVVGNYNYSLLSMFSNILGTAEQSQTDLAKNYNILPSTYVDQEQQLTYAQVKGHINSSLKEANKLKISTNNLKENRYVELNNYNKNFPEYFKSYALDGHLGMIDPNEFKGWKQMAEWFLPKVNGEESLYPVSQQEFVHLYTSEAMKGRNGFLATSPNNWKKNFNSITKEDEDGSQDWGAPDRGTFKGYKGYAYKNLGGYDYRGNTGEWGGSDFYIIGDPKTIRFEGSTYDISNESPEEIATKFINDDAKLAYAYLKKEWDRHLYDADWGGLSGYGTVKGLEGYGAGSTFIAPPVSEDNVGNNQIFSESFQGSKQFIEKFLELKKIDKSALPDEYEIKYANKKTGSINAEEILDLIYRDYYEPGEFDLEYTDKGLPIYSGKMFDKSGDIKETSDFGMDIKFSKYGNGDIALKLIPSIELLNKTDYKGQSKKTVYQNEAAIKGGITIVIPARNAKAVMANNLFSGMVLNNGLSKGFTISDFHNTAGIIQVTNVEFNDDKGDFTGNALFTPKLIRNNLVTGEPEYFNGPVQEYRSEESYRSASEMYDILYDDLKIEDGETRKDMLQAIKLYKEGLDIFERPLKNQNNADK